MVSSVPRKWLSRSSRSLWIVWGAADEAHRGHAVAVAIERPVGGFTHGRVIGQTQVVVGAEVDDLAIGGPYGAALGTRQHALRFVQALLFEGVELGVESIQREVFMR